MTLPDPSKPASPEPLLVIEVATPLGQLLARLPPAEAAVARGAAAGLSNAEIARARSTAVRTVDNQLASLFTRFGVTSRAELVRALDGLPPVADPA
jgi:DNA-binding NarL/FixJ family response regulator